MNVNLKYILLLCFVLFLFTYNSKEKLLRGNIQKKNNCCDTLLTWNWPSSNYEDASILIDRNMIIQNNNTNIGFTYLENIKKNQDLIVCDSNGNYVKIKKGEKNNCCDSKILWNVPYIGMGSIKINDIPNELTIKNGNTLSGGNFYFKIKKNGKSNLLEIVNDNYPKKNCLNN